MEEKKVEPRWACAERDRSLPTREPTSRQACRAEIRVQWILDALTAPDADRPIPPSAYEWFSRAACAYDVCRLRRDPWSRILFGPIRVVCHRMAPLQYSVLGSSRPLTPRRRGPPPHPHFRQICPPPRSSSSLNRVDVLLHFWRLRRERTLGAMANLGSLRSLLEHQHELHAYCSHCERWVALDLEAMVRRGKSSKRLPLVVRCPKCGRLGKLQLRPPTPTRGAVGWITPPASPF